MGRGRRRPDATGRRPLSTGSGRESADDGDWVVRPVSGAASTRTYRCPGCDQEIRPGTPHVVTWPVYARDSDLDPWDTESSVDWRRHWHTVCWRSRDRRH